MELIDFCGLVLFGERSTSAGYSTPSLLCGVHLFGGDKVFVDACIWDEFLDDHCCAQTLHLILVPCWTVAAGGSSDAVGSSELNPELNQTS